MPLRTLDLIADWRVKTTDQQHRGHLGCSEIGKADDCARAVWYSFRFCKPAEKEFNARMLRLFESGHLAEKRFVEELRGIGISVLELDAKTGRQWRFETHGGHFSGSCDGISLSGIPEVPNKPILFEFKTASDKYFKELAKDGLIKAKFVHYIQMQMYLHLSQKWETPINHGFYMCVNKNDDTVYTEVMQYDALVAERFMNLAKKIILAKEPPEKCSDNPAFFTCKFCDFYSLCHEEQVPPVSCRTCVSASPVKGGWQCERRQEGISLEEQRVGCAEHLYIPPLVAFAKAVDASEDWVRYEQEGVEFYNVTKSCQACPDKSKFLSSEIAVKNSKHLLVDQFVQELKDEFRGMRIIE